MTISFHCECCKKKVKAPDAAGGKWGSCPYCQHRCFIPRPISEDEPELKLAPIDESELSQIDDLMKETHTLTQQILHENSIADESIEEKGPARAVQEKEVTKQCIIYLREMVDGELMRAEKTLTDLRKHKKTALRIFSAMGRSERPEPELSDVPDTILQGLIRDAAAKLS
jgi:DNA-directed RNA polymerase subunit RPC12/RpoP